MILKTIPLPVLEAILAEFEAAFAQTQVPSIEELATEKGRLLYAAKRAQQEMVQAAKFAILAKRKEARNGSVSDSRSAADTGPGAAGDPGI